MCALAPDATLRQLLRLQAEAFWVNVAHHGGLAQGPGPHVTAEVFLGFLEVFSDSTAKQKGSNFSFKAQLFFMYAFVDVPPPLLLSWEAFDPGSCPLLLSDRIFLFFS